MLVANLCSRILVLYMITILVALTLIFLLLQFILPIMVNFFLNKRFYFLGINFLEYVRTSLQNYYTNVLEKLIPNIYWEIQNWWNYGCIFIIFFINNYCLIIIYIYITCNEHIVVPTVVNNNIGLGPLKSTLPYSHVSCESKNLIYILSCELCQEVHYIGETEQSISDRMYGHRSKRLPVFHHFHSADHSLSNLKVSILQKLPRFSSCVYRRGIEYFYIMLLRPWLTLNTDFAPPWLIML